jgi:DNA polymerase-3 subunit epsilon
MALKSIVVGIMGLDMLKQICSDWDIVVSDRRVVKLLKEAIIENNNITGKDLLDYLNEKEIKNICSLYGISNIGHQHELVDRLIVIDNKESPTFIAIDFETADCPRDSACAVALIKVKGHRIIQRHYYLIRPPRRRFRFTHLHGLRWEDVRDEPSFRELWPRIEPLFKDIKFLVAHNASFDQSVLNACCETNNINTPKIAFKCTVTIARQFWNIYPTKLNNVCEVLQIPLDHHYAPSDAEAAARIFIRASAEHGNI